VIAILIILTILPYTSALLAHPRDQVIPRQPSRSCTDIIIVSRPQTKQVRTPTPPTFG
jgi:hypothetical protein